MKIFIIFLCSNLISYWQTSTPSEKIVILFCQLKGSPPVGITKEEFWDSGSDFDTLILASKNLVKKVEDNLKHLNPIDIDGFSHESAFLRYSNGVIQDTIYSDFFFHYWEIKNKIYEDTTKYFRKLLVNFYDRDH